MKIKFLVLFLGLICTSVLYAQERHEKGTYEMKVTKIELSPEVGADSTMMLKQIQKQMSKFDYTCVFTKDVVTIVQEVDVLFEKKKVRTVKDLIHKQQYFVREAGYKKDTLKEPTSGLPYEVKILSEKALDKKVFGLSQISYTCLVNNQDTVVVATTNDISIPTFLLSDALNMAQKGTLTSIVFNIGIATVTYEMISFVPEVEDEGLISTDFSMMQNLAETIKVPDNSKEKAKDWVKELEEEYGVYRPQGENLDILQQIVKDGYLDAESIEHIVEDKADIDIPAIIEKLGMISFKKKGYFSLREPKSIISDFKKWGMHSPSISTMLSHPTYWNSIDTFMRPKALAYASIHDALKSKPARQLIVDNAKSIRFVTDADESINKQFVDGNMGIDEWYGQYDTHYPLKKGTATQVGEVYLLVKRMFGFAFADMPVDAKVSIAGDEVQVKSKGTVHVLAMEDLYEDDYDRYNEAENRYEKKESIEYNQAFYGTIVDKIKQVAADNGVGETYSVFTTNPVGPRNFDTYEYEELIRNFPEMAHYEERLYLKKNRMKVYDSEARLNMSFPYHPDRDASYQTSIGPGHFVGAELDANYVPSESKLTFIRFLRENGPLYNLNAADVAKDSVTIMNSLMKGSENLIHYLGSVKFTVQKEGGFQPEYRKTFTKDKNGLDVAYPAISRVLGDDLVISDFRYDEKEQNEYFTFEGKEYSIKPAGANMMKFIGENIDKSTSKKRFFRDNEFSMSREVYYYLLPEHADLLKNLVHLPLK